MIQLPRLQLIPATLPLARAELHHSAEFARLLGATVPENWPPETVVDALPLFLEWMEADPDSLGWYGWYALAQLNETPTLVAGGGFLGPPRAELAMVGYSVLPQFQKRGYATEMLGGLVSWALSQPNVSVIAAETEYDNPASVRVLEKSGFRFVGPTGNPGGQRFEKTR